MTLHAWQRDGATKIVESCRRLGGALLADDVGMGKSRTALEAARRLGGPVVVVCPPSLRWAWRGEAEALSMEVRLVSWGVFSREREDEHEKLNRFCGVVIADEAHRLRNLTIRRREEFERFAIWSTLILITATPVVNRLDDLAALVSLYATEAGWAEACEARCLARVGVVRRRWHDVDPSYRVPREVGRTWTGPPLPVGEDWERACEAVMAVDGSPAALFESTVTRRWASSPEAAHRSWTRARLLLEAWRDAGGPSSSSRAEAARDLVDDDASRCWAQGALPFAPRDASSDLVRALEVVERVCRSLERVRFADTPQAHAIEAHLRSCPGPTLFFTQYVTSAHALCSWLERLGARVVRICGDGGWHRASGRVPLEVAVSWFSGRWAAHFDAVVLTPVACEGWNLQGAAAVVHLDLPWHPAAVEQREGRACRLGGASSVRVHRVVPHPSVEARIHALDLLLKKAKVYADAERGAPSLRARGWPTVRAEIDGVRELAAMLWRAGAEAESIALLRDVAPRLAEGPSRLACRRLPDVWRPGSRARDACADWSLWAQELPGAGTSGNGA